MISKHRLILVLIFFSASVFANNLLVKDVSLVDQNIAGGFTYVQFDVSWENSWRTSTSDPYNYDAIWVFIKFKVEGETIWKHASLSTNIGDHSVSMMYDVSAEFKVGETNDVGKGVFIQRSADGTGSINWEQVKIKWLYSLDGVADNENVTVKVFAIEMVYIPGGTFYVGDGTTTNIAGHLHRADDPSEPFQITSENEVWLGGEDINNIGNNNRSGQGFVLDDFNNNNTKTLPADYPKGYNAFYMMKYEITQGQYVDFLNCLTRTQQNNRTATNFSIGITSPQNRYVMTHPTGSSTVSHRNSIKCPVSIHESDPITFYCDLDDNEIQSDGTDLALNFFHVLDGTAYADWAGLRPFTELEFEKACRGSNEAPWSKTPVTNEYGWGNNLLYSSSYLPLNNAGLPNELPNSVSTGTNGNSAYNGTISWNFGPLRAGIFATGSSDRIIAGASYYGVMELTGNLWEPMVCIGRPKGRSFIGTHGDGYLYNNGEHNISDWPGYVPPPGLSGLRRVDGIGFRGGGYNWAPQYLRISDRIAANATTPDREFVDGMRLARTAP